MAKVYSIDGIVPVIDPSSFVHEDAVLIGDVIVGPRCYIGPCASLRGDFGRIRLSEGVNIQDTCVLHSFPEVDVIIEKDGHIGHGAVVHGCIVRQNAIIGMNAVVMDNAVIGENSFVAACSFVKAGMKVPPNTLVAGVPARVIRDLQQEEIDWKSSATRNYQKLAGRSLRTMRPADPLEREEQDRRRVMASRQDIVSLDIKKARS